MTDVSGLIATLEHYLGGVLRTAEDRRRAYDLAVANVHAPVQRALEDVGSVTVSTDEDIGDISCIYEVDGPGPEAAMVFISTVLPYAAVILTHTRRYSRFGSMKEVGWPASVVSCLTERGFLVLPDEACRAKRPNPRWPDGPIPSYFEDLFEDEFGPPEDWFWVGDPELADELGERP
ncbi:hypothetical protein [Modestobacter sp. NPDC049651]|uniref:hypothetical protein n=1 Tax=unclassified Modestobacter TaxID=2643866 RepID=UPI0033FD2192